MAQLLKGDCAVKVFEKESTPGGLIRCKHVNGNLFHICGGHVFNTKMQDVADWFWKFFDREKEFTLSDRNSVVFLPDGRHIPYPIENHAYMLDEHTQYGFINDLLSIYKNAMHSKASDNFEDFLKKRFGQTLYDLYFKPYNIKVWRRDLSGVPLDWLEGKLPMPTVEEMIYNNFKHVEEKKFVHSTFWYERTGGSQFIADRLSQGLDIAYNTEIGHIDKDDKGWEIGGEHFDKVVFCGNVKQLPSLLDGIDLGRYSKEIESLESHGTTSVFCEIEANPYSWIYLPNPEYESHRIICTGNFSKNNNVNDSVTTGTVEFTDYISKDDILANLNRMPLHPHYLDHHYSKYTYPIQKKNTRNMIRSLKQNLSKYGLYMTGRFADWEYYNMDAAIKAAMQTNKIIVGL